MEILHDLKMQFIDLLLVRWIFWDKLDIRIMRILNTLPFGEIYGVEGVARTNSCAASQLAVGFMV